MAHEHAALGHGIGAHASERGRVDVERHRGIDADVANTMDIRRREMKRLPGGEHPVAWLTLDRESLLAYTPPATATAPAETSWS